jgi:hypothetical protein
MGGRRTWGGSAAAALFALGLAPEVAAAHEVAGSRFDAPLPLWALLAGAGATVALTALWLGFTGRTPAASDHRRLLTVPARAARPLRAGARTAFLVAVLGVLAVGVVGRQAAAENFATVFTWPVWFRGVALVAVLFGSPWPVLSPWRTVYRGLVRVEGRHLAVGGEYPARLGAWPAVAGVAALLGVVEPLTVVPRSPRLTTVVVAVYALLMVGGAVVYGTAWLRHADPLGVLYRLLGRVAPLVVSRTGSGGYEVGLRPPWRGCLEPVEGTPLVVAALAAVYTVSFDGFATTRAFESVLLGVRAVLGTGPASVVLYAVGFGGVVASFGLVVRLAERLGTGTGDGWPAATRAFAPTVLPIAAGYEVAHNYPYVVRNLARLPAVVAEPLFPGLPPLDLLGWLSLPLFWGSQVALVVAGHAVAVVAAHGVAVRRFGPAAGRAHLPLAALMVGYTMLSLWVVSQPVVAG